MSPAEIITATGTAISAVAMGIATVIRALRRRNSNKSAIVTSRAE